MYSQQQAYLQPEPGMTTGEKVLLAVFVLVALYFLYVWFGTGTFGGTAQPTTPAPVTPQPVGGPVSVSDVPPGSTVAGQPVNPSVGAVPISGGAVAMPAIVPSVMPPLSSGVPRTADGLPVASPTLQVTPAQSPRWHFYQGLDSNSANLGHFPGTLAEMKAKCNSEPTCLGFNNNGYMKSSLAPRNTWYTWTTVPGRGFRVHAERAGALLANDPNLLNGAVSEFD